MSEDVRVISSYRDPGYQIELRSDGILCYRATPGMTLTLEIAKRLLEDGLTLTEEARPCLVLMQDVARVERRARDFFSSDQYLTLASQTALVVGSPISRVIGNFFVGLNRPKYPLRIFDDPRKAIEWLRGFLR